MCNPGESCGEVAVVVGVVAAVSKVAVAAVGPRRSIPMHRPVRGLADA